MKNLLLILILGIFLLSLVSAEIDLTNGGTSAYKKGKCIELQQTCSNCTYVNVTTITYPNSTLIFINDVMTKTGTKYNYSFCSTSPLGRYRYSVLGDKNGISSTEEGFFEITPNGDVLNTQKSILYIALSGILLFFFILIIYFAGKLPDSEIRNDDEELIGINNLKYIGSILIFVNWMILISIFYITSNLAYAYLGEVLFADILFMLFKVCLSLTLPIVIIWFCWIIYNIFKDKKLKRLISKGIYPSGRNN